MSSEVNCYFTDEDYDVFEASRQVLNGKAERDDRANVKTKLLLLNNGLLPRLTLAGFDLHNHPNKKNITSITMPCEYNKGHVNWLGVRYGKSKAQLDLLNYGLQPRRKYGSSSFEGDEDILGFQKYACLQVDICYDGVDVGIYHAVPNDALDRAYLHENIDKEDLKSKIIEELDNIKFNGYVWEVYDPVLNQKSVFDFDNNKSEDFIKWYKDNDDVGKYSSMLKHFPRKDKRIYTENIEDTCFDVISNLYNLYKLLSWQPKESEV